MPPLTASRRVRTAPSFSLGQGSPPPSLSGRPWIGRPRASRPKSAASTACLRQAAGWTGGRRARGPGSHEGSIVPLTPPTCAARRAVFREVGMAAQPTLVRRPPARTARQRGRAVVGSEARFMSLVPSRWAPARRRCRRRPGQPRPWLRTLALPRAPGRRIPARRRRPNGTTARRPRRPVAHSLREHRVKARVVRHSRLLREPSVHRQRVRQLARRHVRREASRRIRPIGRVQRVGEGRRQRSEKAAVAPPVAVGRRPVQATSDDATPACNPTRGALPRPANRLVPAVVADAVVLRRRRLAGAARAGLHVDVTIHGVVLFGPFSLVARRFRTAKPVSAPFGFRRASLACRCGGRGLVAGCRF